MGVTPKMIEAGRDTLREHTDEEIDVAEIYLAMQAADDTTVSVNEAIKLADEAADHAAAAADDQRNRLREALVDIRNRILCPVGPSPTLDEVEAIASAALAADDGREEG